MEKTVGNNDLISSEEEKWAKFLKDRNLAMVNEMSAAVYPANNFYINHIKRLLDLLISVPVFILLFPLNLIFGICTFFDVGRPIFYKQTRIGKDGKPFILVKFRNMNEKKDKDGKLLPAKDRVTKFGKFMRKYSLDELLNFWSVIKGDMSIIGPRPLPEFFTERMSERHKMRNAIRPGLECPRVLKDNQSVSQYQNQFENDIWYIENVGFFIDVYMVFLLIKMTFNFGKRTKAAKVASYFIGYDDDGRATSIKQYIKDYPDVAEMLR